MSASEGRTDFPFKVTLGSTLGAIGCKLLRVEDAEATARIAHGIASRSDISRHTLLGLTLRQKPYLSG